MEGHLRLLDSLQQMTNYKSKQNRSKDQSHQVTRSHTY